MPMNGAGHLSPVEVTGPVRASGGRELVGAPKLNIHDQVDTTGLRSRSDTHRVDMTMKQGLEVSVIVPRCD
jgi:hypothetical protein